MIDPRRKLYYEKELKPGFYILSNKRAQQGSFNVFYIDNQKKIIKNVVKGETSAALWLINQSKGEKFNINFNKFDFTPLVGENTAPNYREVNPIEKHKIEGHLNRLQKIIQNRK